MLSEEEIDIVEQWSKDTEYLSTAISNEDASVYREMNEGILQLMQSFGSYSQLIPVGKEEFFGIEDLYSAIQLQFEGGEDLMKD